MALIKCPECGKEISDKAVSCPNCGVPIAEKFAKKVPVVFSRSDKLYGYGIKGIVIVDGERVGTANRGESFTINLPVGNHTIEISSGTQVTNRSVASSLFFGAPLSSGGDRGSKIQTLSIDDKDNKVFIEISVMKGNNPGLEISSIRKQ